MQSLDENKLYRLQEVAELTGESARNLRDWAWMGRIRAQKVGRSWRMNAEQIRQFIDGGTKPKPTKVELMPEPEDVLEGIDLREIEIRITDLIQEITGTILEDPQRDELLSILEDFMRAAGAKGGLEVVGKDSSEMKGLRRRARRHGMKILTDRSMGLFYLVDISINAVVSPALDESGISSWLDDYDKEAMP